MAANPLQILSNVTGGLDSFGEAAQYYGASVGFDQTAELQDISAKGIIANAEFDARRQREQGSKVISTQRALYAKAGVNMSGSAAIVAADTEKNLRLDVLVTQMNAANRANAVGFEALQNRIKAGQARTNAIRKVGQGILDIGTNFAIHGTGGKTPTQSEMLGFNTADYR